MAPLLKAAHSAEASFSSAVNGRTRQLKRVRPKNTSLEFTSSGVTQNPDDNSHSYSHEDYSD